MRKFNYKRLIVMLVVVLAMACLMATTAFAAGTGDVAGAGQFEWAAPAILFACLVFTLTAPMYLWDIVGI